MGKPKKTGRPRRRVVWAVSWETNSMAGSDYQEVRERGGWFHVDAVYGNPHGRHPTLREAVRVHDLGRLPDDEVVMEIMSPILSPSEMAQLLDPSDAEYGSAVILNTEVWVYDDPGVFRLAEEDEE